MTFGSNIDKPQRPTLGERICPHDNGLKLAVGQPNSREKIQMCAMVILMASS